MTSDLSLQPQSPSLAQTLICNTIGTGLGMGINFGQHYLLLSGIEKIRQYVTTPVIPEPTLWQKVQGITPSPEDHSIPVVELSMLQALSVPARVVTSNCIPRLLGCREDTPWRNVTANITTSLSSTAIAAVACNALGYSIDTSALIYQQVFGLGLMAGLIVLSKGAEYLAESLIDETARSILEEDENQEIETEVDIDDATFNELFLERFNTLPPATMTKTEEVKQKIFS